MSRAISRTFQIAAVVVALGTAVPVAASLAQKMPEPTLKDRIEYGLETSSVVRRYDIKVKVDGTEATLTGSVATEAQKAEAVRLAKVAGATKIQDGIVIDRDADKTVSERVKNGLTKTGDKVNDGWILTKVKWFYWGDEGLRGSDIDVDVKDGIVTLKGTVKSTASRTRAVELATDTDGVKRVIDELVVR